jgi:hypothetical protein
MNDMKNLGYIIGAGIVGVLIGNAIGSSSATGDATTKRLDELAAQVEALGGSNEAVAAIESRTASLGSDIAALAEQSDALAGQVESLSGTVDTLGAEVAATGESLSGFAVELGGKLTLIEDLFDRLAAAPATAPAPAAEAEPEAAAPAADDAAEPDEGARLASMIGPEGLVLSVGQTGRVREQGVFLSRIGEDMAQILLVGSGRATAGLHSGPVDLGNGCMLSYVGAADGKAYLKADCAG